MRSQSSCIAAPHLAIYSYPGGTFWKAPEIACARLQTECLSAALVFDNSLLPGPRPQGRAVLTLAFVNNNVHRRREN